MDEIRKLLREKADEFQARAEVLVTEGKLEAEKAGALRKAAAILEDTLGAASAALAGEDSFTPIDAAVAPAEGEITGLTTFTSLAGQADINLERFADAIVKDWPHFREAMAGSYLKLGVSIGYLAEFYGVSEEETQKALTVLRDKGMLDIIFPGGDPEDGSTWKIWLCGEGPKLEQPTAPLPELTENERLLFQTMAPEFNTIGQVRPVLAELSTMSGIPRGSIRGAITGLEQKKVIRQLEVPTSNRAALYGLTDIGRPMRDAAV